MREYCEQHVNIQYMIPETRSMQQNVFKPAIPHQHNHFIAYMYRGDCWNDWT